MENKDAKNNQPEQYEEKRIQKHKDSVRSLSFYIMGVPEGERKSKKLEIYLKK